MKEYVVGFLFDEAKKKVALILKNRPEWQAGKWNGLGGKREGQEYWFAAMMREFKEETGADVVGWDEFATLESQDALIVCFTASEDVKIETMEDEEVAWHDLDNLPANCLPNLSWLIPLALDYYREQKITRVTYF